eukprot:gene1068-1211_t
MTLDINTLQLQVFMGREMFVKKSSVKHYIVHRCFDRQQEYIYVIDSRAFFVRISMHTTETKQLASLASPLGPNKSCALVHDGDNKIYFFGGHNRPYSTYTYQISSDKWFEAYWVASNNRPYLGNAINTGSDIYLFGGQEADCLNTGLFSQISLSAEGESWNSKDGKIKEQIGIPMSRLDRFNIQTKQITQLGDPKYPVSSAFTFIVGDKLYIVGGKGMGAKIMKLDINTLQLRVFMGRDLYPHKKSPYKHDILHCCFDQQQEYIYAIDSRTLFARMCFNP